MTDIASLLAMVVQSARECEAATRLPHCIAGAQKRLDEACAALSDRIAELEGERRAVTNYLRAEAGAARVAQDKAALDHPDKLYRMGQKDGLMLAADAIERGHHIPALTKEGQASG